MKTIFSFLILSVSVSAFAGKDNHPCMEVKKACESAGFKKGDHKDGKGLWKDCIDKIANGETVAGVTISADTVAACKAKKDAKHGGH